jgi:hypothetical protein
VTPELTALLIAVAAGAGATLLLDRRAAGSLVAGESLLLGVGISAAVLFALSSIGVPWTRISFGLAMGIAIVVAWAMVPRFGARERSVESWRKRDGLSIGLLVFAALLVAGYAVFATVAPVWEFDFLADWGLKARAFAAARSVDWRFLEHPLHAEIHPDYPPLVPLAFDLFAVVRNSWNDQTVGLISVVFGAALLLVVHRLALEETGRPLTAAFITVALVPFACSPWIGLAEGALVAYGTTGMLLIRRGSVLPGAVMLGLAASSKNEGLTLVLAVAVALAVERRGRALWRLWPALAIPLPWLILRRLHALQTDITGGDAVGRLLAHLRDPRPLLEAFVHYGAGKPVYWIALAIGMLVAFRTLVKQERFVLVALGMQLAFYIGAYLITPHDVDWHVHWSWERLISHLTPALTYVVLVALTTASPPPPDDGLSSQGEGHSR